MIEPTQSEKDFERCVRMIKRSRDPIKLFLSQAGHPTIIEGVGCMLIGVYTRKVSIEQLEEDIRETDRQRRRRAAA